MADSLRDAGKQQGMEGIEFAITSIELWGNDSSALSTESVGPSDFSTVATVLSNTSAIDFTIAAGAVGFIASYVRLESSGGSLLYIDLENNITLSTEGTATIAIGDLTAEL